MRFLLLTFLFWHLPTWGDVIHSENDAIAEVHETSADLGFSEEGEQSSSAHGFNSLFWLPILNHQTIAKPQTAMEPSASNLDLTAKPSPYWQLPNAEKSWPLPEPGTLLLFGAGILLMLVARHVHHRNRNKKNESLNNIE